MNIRLIATMLLAVLLLSGCSSSRIGQQANAAVNAAESQVAQAESELERAFSSAPAAAAAQTAPTPGSAALTREEAEAIALKHAGLSADQVKYLRTAYEIDDGVPQYEVEFHHGRWEYTYEIQAETGSILSFEKDD